MKIVQVIIILLLSIHPIEETDLEQAQVLMAGNTNQLMKIKMGVQMMMMSLSMILTQMRTISLRMKI